MGWIGNFQHELRRRRMYRAATVYLVVAWGGTEIVTFFLERLPFPDWAVPVLAILFVVGFPVAMLLAWQFDITTDGVRSTGPSSAKGNLTILLSVTLLVGGSTGLYYLIYPDGIVSGGNIVAGDFDPPERSVAVLPFVDLSRDQDQEYLASGLAETLLHQLAQVDDLHVIARASSFSFTDQDPAFADIGRRLDVGTILHGSVQKQNGTLRITARLVDTIDNASIWSASFDRSDSNIFEIQDEIATTVMLALMDSLGDGDPLDSADRFTTHVDAYELYLLGRHFWHQRTEASLTRAIGLFQQAVEIDPHFALAYTALADTYGVLPDYSALSVDDVAGLAEAALTQAFAIDPELAEAHASKGLILLHSNKLEEADRELQKAIALEPGYAMAHMWSATSLARQQRYEEALDAALRARRLDPLSAVIGRHVAVAYFWTGDFISATREYERSIAIAPHIAFGYAGLGVLERTFGRFDDAVVNLHKAVDVDPDNLLLIRELAWAWSSVSEDTRADAWLADAEAIDPFDPFVIFGRKLYYLEIGRHQEFVDYTLFNVDEMPDNLFARADLGLAYALSRDFEKATETYGLVRARETVGDSPLFQDWDFVYGYSHALQLINAYQETGETELATALATDYERFVADAVDRGVSVPNVWYFMAGLNALHGDVDQALEHLHTAYDQGWRSYRIARNDPVMDRLRDHPRYEALLARTESDVDELRGRLRASPPVGVSFSSH